MLGEKIKTLRINNSLTQKDLAEKLYVTAQAVSRWENNEVEPSITTLTEMAKIFNISVSELLGEEVKEKQQEVASSQVNQVKPVLAICECCNKPIYDGKEIVRRNEYINGVQRKVICKTCDKKQREAQLTLAVAHGIEQRRKSFVRGGIFSGLITLVFVLICLLSQQKLGTVITWTLIGASFFPFFSCLYLDNNFIGDVFGEVATWSFNFPGIIFSLELDGLISFIAIKVLFGILSFFISVFCFLLALLLGLFLSIFVYPYAIKKNIRYPELTGEI